MTLYIHGSVVLHLIIQHQCILDMIVMMQIKLREQISQKEVVQLQEDGHQL